MAIEEGSRVRVVNNHGASNYCAVGDTARVIIADDRPYSIGGGYLLRFDKNNHHPTGRYAMSHGEWWADKDCIEEIV